MDEYCRICLTYSSSKGGFHISIEVSESKTVSQVVKDFTKIDMLEDNFSKYLCYKCYEQVISVNHFYELIIKSDIHLKQNKDMFSSFADESCSIASTKAELDLDATDIGKSSDKVEPKFVGDNLQIEACKEQKYPGDENKFIRKTEDDNKEAKYSAKNKGIARTIPGRKPSKFSKFKRKVHEFKCDICKKVLFGRSNRLQQHIIMAHSHIKNFECETCNKKFKSKQQLVNHTRVHTGEKPFECEICKEPFASRQNLFNHKKKHSGNYKSYRCESCSKGYLTPGELETHIRIVHTGEKPYLCEICSKSYSSVRNLGLHVRSVHRKTEKCPKCNLMLSSRTVKEHLQKHQDKEDGIRRYTCDKCGKGFFTRHALKKHQVVHSGEKPFSCPVCHKSFNQKSTVDTHMKTHSDVRSFCCELCAKTFKYKQHLQLHIAKMHSDVDVGTLLGDDVIVKDSELLKTVKSEAS